jgi:peptidoglycan/xylan/chitin deacetylase (PgdA/CDA1 family)
MRGISLGAVAIAVLYVACADPPKKFPTGTAGTGGNSSAGDDAGGDGTTGATGGSDAMAGTDAGTAGSSVGGTSSGSGGGGTGGNVAGAAGEAPDAVGGAAGGAIGEAGAAGAAPVEVDPCVDADVGGASKMPAPTTTGVAKPDGAVGNMKVVDWAGFKGALSYTFDDALPSQVTHYPELQAVGVPMTFYLVSNNDKSNAVWTQAAEDGHELGNHTVHHCNADGTSCGWKGSQDTYPDTDDEMDSCTAHIESAFGVEGVYTFASPGGDGGWAAPAKTRFLVARGVYDDPAGVAPNGTTNPFNLPCHISNTDETAEASATGGFNLIADDVRTKHTWRIILNHSFGGDGGYHPTAIGEVVKAMTYAKGLKDVWIDTVVSIGAYWRAQKAVSAVTPVKDGSSRVYSWTLPEHFPPGQFLRVTVDGGTPKQCGTELTWDEHGYYEIALDAGSVTIAP